MWKATTTATRTSLLMPVRRSDEDPDKAPKDKADARALLDTITEALTEGTFPES